MTAVHYIALWGLTSILAAAAGGILAAVKRRDHSFWAAWCFVLPPLVIVPILMSYNKGERPRRPSMDEDDREQTGTI